jgi:hypothetical protein
MGVLLMDITFTIDVLSALKWIGIVGGSMLLGGFMVYLWVASWFRR